MEGYHYNYAEQVQEIRPLHHFRHGRYSASVMVGVVSAPFMLSVELFFRGR